MPKRSYSQTIVHNGTIYLADTEYDFEADVAKELDAKFAPPAAEDAEPAAEEGAGAPAAKTRK